MSMEVLACPNTLVEVLSFLTYDSKQLGWFGALCRPVHEALNHASAWQHLCRRHWYASDERIKDWPALSPRGLYCALEQWSPLEGFYVLTPAYPWGLLVLIRIVDGRILADIIRFVPQADGSFLEEMVALFRVSLEEVQTGVVRSVLEAPWAGGAAASVASLEVGRLTARTLVAGHFFESCRIVTSGLFSARRALRLAFAEEEDEEEEPGSFLSEEWRPGCLFESGEQARQRTEGMLRRMGSSAVPCDLALVRGPADLSPRSADAPGVRPGLYVGDYGHDFYGQYRPEVLLLEYATFPAGDVVRQAGATIFARPEGEPAPAELQLLAGSEQPVTFMQGVKQCGDFHVPMGATTFVAVCGPQEACRALAMDRAWPESVLNRQSGRREVVRRAWRGFGTLAQPGFGHPSWDGGWLVEVTEEQGSQRFGFVWDRQQDAVVLRWVAAQDAYPFLQRSWLPQELQ